LAVCIQRLHDATQKLIDRTPNLHRKVAEQLALDGDPKLADEHEQGDELQANQQRIKDWVKAEQAKHPKLTFRDAWSKCQAAHSGWFEGFETP
jgi:hypothetical protein